MKKQNHSKSLRCSIAVAVCASLAGLSAMAQGTTVPYPDIGTPIPNFDAQLVYANGGDIVATYYHGISNGDHDVLYLNGTPIFDNKVNSPGNTVDLGTFAPGTLLDFTMEDFTTANTWNMGSGTGNSDGAVHAYVVDNYPTSGNVYVGWEDWPASESDFNYNDLTFTFSNIELEPVPEPTTLALSAVAGLGLLLFRRRK
jgi:hypothetical protein